MAKKLPAFELDDNLSATDNLENFIKVLNTLDATLSAAMRSQIPLLMTDKADARDAVLDALMNAILAEEQSASGETE